MHVFHMLFPIIFFSSDTLQTWHIKCAKHYRLRRPLSVFFVIFQTKLPTGSFLVFSAVLYGSFDEFYMFVVSLFSPTLRNLKMVEMNHRSSVLVFISSFCSFLAYTFRYRTEHGHHSSMLVSLVYQYVRMFLVSTLSFELAHVRIQPPQFWVLYT